MSVSCAKCAREYDDALFARDRVVLCGCGEWVEPAQRIARREVERARDEARAEVDELRRRADRITSLILYTDMPEVDIEIEAAKLREVCRERFPGSVALFDMVYAARWRRLREQGWARGGPRPSPRGA